MKYIIEIENEPYGRNDDPFMPHGMDELYRAKGFNSLVFDTNGLNKLTPYTEPDKDQIENDVWEFARSLLYHSEDEWNDLVNLLLVEKESYKEAKAKYEAWKKQKDEIRVGDEILVYGLRRVVTSIDDEDIMAAIDSDGATYGVPYNKDNNEITRTGRHFPEVVELLKKMREE